jgi:heat shock protein HtpX
MKNQIKTVILLGLLTALLLWVGSFWGKNGLLVALIFSIAMNLVSYFFSDKIVLFMYRAKEATPRQQPELHRIVDEVAREAKIPKPRVYIVPSDNPNAFATGRNPKNAVVACTTGILKLLNKEELKGVIAHEMSHIRNRDILIQTIAATIAGVIGYIASMARWAAIFGYGGDDKDNNILELLVLIILVPILATLLQLALSRSREYIADESAARTLRTGKGLADALEKLEKEGKKNPMRFGSKTTSALFITNPFSANAIFNLFSTHPPLQERVKKLRAMKF